MATKRDKNKIKMFFLHTLSISSPQRLSMVVTLSKSKRGRNPPQSFHTCKFKIRSSFWLSSVLSPARSPAQQVTVGLQRVKLQDLCYQWSTAMEHWGKSVSKRHWTYLFSYHTFQNPPLLDKLLFLMNFWRLQYLHFLSIHSFWWCNKSRIRGTKQDVWNHWSSFTNI